MGLTVVTDSSACLRAAPIPGRLTVLPLTIHLPSADLLDDVEGAAQRVFEALARGEAVKSSSPSTISYLEAIEQEGNDAVVVITPAVEFTAMYRNARLAAHLAAVPAEVVDSRTAAAGQALVVEEALAAADRGACLEEVVAAARDASIRCELVATIDDPDTIRQSGRVPPGTLDSAQRLGVRPIFALREGVVERLGAAQSSQRALERVHREWLERGGRAASAVAVFHAARPQAARWLSAVAGREARVTEFSAAMGIQTGPGVVGLAWLRPPD